MSIRKFRPSLCEIIFWLGLLGGVGAIVLSSMMVLRTAPAEVGGYPARDMYLAKMTGFSGSTQAYSWFGEETCKHYRVSVGQLSDPVTAASNEALANASPTKFCSMYRGCRDIEAVRCIWYKKIDEAGSSTSTMIMAGTGLYAVACVLVVFRLNPKIIAAVGIISGFVVIYGFLGWVNMSDAMMNFQRTMVFYPYASLTTNAKAVFGCGLWMCLAPLSALRMVDNYKEAPDAPPDAEGPQAGEFEEEEAENEEET